MLGSAARRRLKYTLGADILNGIVRHTPWLDGQGHAAPPEFINFAGHQNFDGVGDHTVALVRELAGLSGGETVLDIGCAIARNALALHRAFGDTIDYRGFDIVSYGIRWSQKRFDTLPGDYRFTHADVHNGFYNPRGRVAAQDFVFPYADNSVDVSVATSVYTHMRRASVERYLRETARVSRAGGRAYFTLFARDGVGEGSTFTFAHAGEGDWIEDAAEPEMAVAHDMDWVRALLEALGATRVDVHPGYWRGDEGRDFQDIVVAHWGNSR